MCPGDTAGDGRLRAHLAASLTRPATGSNRGVADSATLALLGARGGGNLVGHPGAARLSGRKRYPLPSNRVRMRPRLWREIPASRAASPSVPPARSSALFT